MRTANVYESENHNCRATPLCRSRWERRTVNVINFYWSTLALANHLSLNETPINSAYLLLDASNYFGQLFFDECRRFVWFLDIVLNQRRIWLVSSAWLILKHVQDVDWVATALIAVNSSPGEWIVCWLGTIRGEDIEMLFASWRCLPISPTLE